MRSPFARSNLTISIFLSNIFYNCNAQNFFYNSRNIAIDFKLN